MTVTLAEVKNLIDEAIKKERERLVTKIYNAKEHNDGDYYKPQFSFSESMRELANDIEKGN